MKELLMCPHCLTTVVEEACPVHTSVVEERGSLMVVEIPYCPLCKHFGICPLEK